VDSAELAATSLVLRGAGADGREFLASALTQSLPRGRQREAKASGRREGGGALAHPAVEASNGAAVRAAVLAGTAPAVMSRMAVADDLLTGRLSEVPVADLDLRRDLHAVWTGPRAPRSVAARELLQAVGERSSARQSSQISHIKGKGPHHA
jgi:DNA-binding transcriptional LysR family regulator